MKKEYTLVDANAQLALEKLFPGFGRALANASFVRDGSGLEQLARLQLMQKGGNESWVLYVPGKDVTWRVVYEPGVWNEPDVIPPEGVPMCVELTDEFGHVFRRMGSFNNGKWAITDFPSGRVVLVKRFRSWE